MSFSLTARTTGLGTVLTVAAPTTNQYTVSGKMTPPSINRGDTASSQLVAVVNQNGSPIYTGQPGAAGLEVTTHCAAGDILTVVFSSSAAVDQPINTIRATLGVAEGES